MENGYHFYDFKGELLREEHIEKFKQLLWRPRPATLLSKDEQKTIRKNLREYSRDFDEQDRIEEDKEKGAIVDERRRLLSEWLAWRRNEEEELNLEKAESGIEDKEEEEEEAEGGKVVEEIVEEVLDEIEEIVPWRRFRLLITIWAAFALYLRRRGGYLLLAGVGAEKKM